MKKLHLFLFVAALSCFVMGCRKPVDVSFGIESLNVAAEGGTYTAELKSNGDWTIGSTAEWLTVMPTSGNCDATLTFEVQPNLTGQVRNQEITATTKDNAASMTISQVAGSDPALEPYITLTPNSMLGDWEGGSFQVIVQANIAWTVTGLPSPAPPRPPAPVRSPERGSGPRSCPPRAGRRVLAGRRTPPCE